MIEGRLLAHHRLHAAHPRREFRAFDVQFDVGGELAGVTVRTQVVGTRDFHRADGGEYGFGAQFPVVGRATAGARQGALVGGRNGELQPLSKTRGSRPMRGGAHHHLAGFQVRVPGLAPTLKQDVQPLAYFASDLVKDRSSRFFSSGVQAPSGDSRGRCRQIFSLIAINSAMRRWKR